MIPSNEDIIKKYQANIAELKQSLIAITKFDNMPVRRRMFVTLTDEEYNMMVKGYRHSRMETENLIHNRYTQIGRLVTKQAKEDLLK